MRSRRPLPESLRAARTCVLLFCGAAVVSFAYVLATGTYNGDFFGVAEELGGIGQSLMLVFTLTPYALGWVLYRRYRAIPLRGRIPVPPRRLTITFFAFMAWFIVLAIKYDVGVLAKEIYDAPALIKPIIQISNRVNPFYLGVLFILLHRGSRKVLLLGIAAMIALGILRAGLGVFLYIFLALVLRYHDTLAHFARRNKLRISIVVLAFPMLVSQLYSLRNTLRDGNEDLELTVVQIISARLVGRLSSFSNSSLVVQESDRVRSDVSQLDPLYFQRQVFGGIFGVAFIPAVTPERLLINIYGGDYQDVSFMVGLPGNLVMASQISVVLAALNVATVVAMCMAVFVLARQLRIPMANEFALLLLLYPLTSGVGNEFSSLVATMASFCVLFGLLSIPLHRRSRRSGRMPICYSA